MKLIPKGVTRTVARQILVSKKNSPHFFFAAGVVGVVASAVLACKATLKLEETIDEIKTDLDNINELKHSSDSETQTQQEHYKELGYVIAKSTGKMARLYGPSIVVGAVSITALTGSHVQLTRRNTALTATLAALSKAYDEYRVRVRDELGPEKELELYRCMEDVELEGEKKPVKVTDPNGWSPYARFFDEASTEWRKDAELNRIFIQCQQNYANHKLHARGHVFLNEVYDSLGLERSRAGSVVGWVIDGEGDNFIDFGLFEASSARFINNLERSIILDFNVDGVIYDKI